MTDLLNCPTNIADELGEGENGGFQEPKKINLKEEIILVFFNSMLKEIVEEWYEIEPGGDKSSVPCESQICSKTFKEIEEEDLLQSNVVSISGSVVSLAKKESESERRKYKRSTSTLASIDSMKHRRGKKTDERDLKVFIDAKSNVKAEIEKDTKRKKSKSKSIPEESEPDPKESEAEQEVVEYENEFGWFLDPPDENVLIKFTNGNKYEGKLSRKVFHGRGTFWWSDGASYEGDFENGQMKGHGTLTFPDLSRYEGDVYNGYREGFGSMCVIGSQIYSGQWKCGKKHGWGWMLYKPGDWYEGEWDMCYKQGYGLRRYSSGDKYLGKWKEGNRHGMGSMLWYNCDMYKGEWDRGKKQGFGEYIWKVFFNKSLAFPSYNSYRGSWYKGNMHGVGIMLFGMDGGARLAGCWQSNQKHGPGVVVCENGQMIESNPLFFNDKPVHLTDSGSLEVCELGDPPFTSTPQKSTSQIEAEPETDLSEMDEHPEELSEEEIKDEAQSKDDSFRSSLSNTQKQNRSSLLMIMDQIESKDVSELKKAVKENIEENRGKFADVKYRYKSILIPLQISDSHIVVGSYIQMIMESFQKSFNTTYNSTEMECYVKSCRSMFKPVSSSKKNSSQDRPSTFKELSNTSYGSKTKISHMTIEDTCTLEEKWLHNTITLHLPRLRFIYDDYASVACLENLPFRPIMVRMFLWQLLRDCHIPQKGLSLSEADVLFAQNWDAGIEKLHDPFEKIYFWQFLHILITLAWVFYEEEVKTQGTNILAGVLTKFLENDLFPNARHYQGSVFFEYKDLFPLQAVYDWYVTFGEPHTVRQFLQKTCTIKKTDPPRHFHAPESLETGTILSGFNVTTLDQFVTYFVPPTPEICTDQAVHPIFCDAEDPCRTNLFLFRHLGARKVLRCVNKICPIIEDGVIVNLEYPLIFLEFYEIFLNCATTYVKQEEGKRYRVKEAKVREILDEILEAVQIRGTSAASSRRVISRQGKKKKA